MRRCCVRWQVAAARNNSFERIAATSIKERLKSAPQRSPVSSEERKNESLTACKDHLVGAGLQMVSAARRRSVDDVELSIEDSAVQFRAIARRRDRGVPVCLHPRSAKGRSTESRGLQRETLDCLCGGRPPPAQLADERAAPHAEGQRPEARESGDHQDQVDGSGMEKINSEGTVESPSNNPKNAPGAN
jgi:hypothetical protein